MSLPWGLRSIVTYFKQSEARSYKAACDFSACELRARVLQKEMDKKGDLKYVLPLVAPIGVTIWSLSREQLRRLAGG